MINYLVVSEFFVNTQASIIIENIPQKTTLSAFSFKVLFFIISLLICLVMPIYAMGLETSGTDRCISNFYLLSVLLIISVAVIILSGEFIKITPIMVKLNRVLSLDFHAGLDYTRNDEKNHRMNKAINRTEKRAIRIIILQGK